MSDYSAFTVAGTNSNCGKTTVTLALLRALRRRGLAVQPFKCGPDYIDPGFHRHAAGRISANLDGWMTGLDGIRRSYERFADGAEVSVLEGVMGLFDGRDGLSGSTAEVALTLDLPVILVVNARGMANSIAALADGYANWHKDLKTAGVIANNVGSERHADILRRALGDRFLGCLPRNDQWTLPERHLGLVPFQENSRSDEWFDSLADALETHLDLDRLLSLTRVPRPPRPAPISLPPALRLAVARDEAFGFYYEENLATLREAGIEIIEFSPLRDSCLPERIDGLYFGGGFPEMFAGELERNEAMRRAVREFPGFIYAECGGYLYLMERLGEHRMTGLVPGCAAMHGKLRSLGYREVAGPLGRARGHEFHYSEARMNRETEPLWAEVTPNGDRGFREGNVHASYIHLHWGNNPAFVEKFRERLSCSG